MEKSGRKFSLSLSLSFFFPFFLCSDFDRDLIGRMNRHDNVRREGTPKTRKKMSNRESRMRGIGGEIKVLIELLKSLNYQNHTAINFTLHIQQEINNALEFDRRCVDDTLMMIHLEDLLPTDRSDRSGLTRGITGILRNRVYGE